MEGPIGVGKTSLARKLAESFDGELILEKVDEGEGTFGLLVNDPTLYDDLKSLVGGAQRSLVVRSLIRLSSEEGADE